MVEHKIITFHKQDVIEALEDYYKKIHGETIDINFDEKALASSNVRDLIVKVVSINDKGIKAELDRSTEVYEMDLSSVSSGISWGISSGPNYVTTANNFINKTLTNP